MPTFPLRKLISIAFASLRDDLAHVLTLVDYRDQSFVITRRGKPCALVLPLAAAEKLGINLEDFDEYESK